VRAAEEMEERMRALSSDLKAQALPALQRSRAGDTAASMESGDAALAEAGVSDEDEDGSKAQSGDEQDDDEQFVIDSGGEEEGAQASASDDEDELSELTSVESTDAAQRSASPSSTGGAATDADATAGNGSAAVEKAAERAEGADIEAEALRAAGGTLGTSGSDADVCASLFFGMVVWLGREVPREMLMLLVRAFGGTPCWDGPGSPFREADDAITHAVVDRPTQGHHRHLGRVYVQPQWVFDSVNFRVLVPAGEYAPGRKPPPHLSPFLDYAQKGYVPEHAQRLLKLQEAATAARSRVAGLELERGAGTFERAAEAEVSAAVAEAAKAAEAEAQFQAQLAEELGALLRRPRS
jgi:pescadillo